MVKILVVDVLDAELLKQFSTSLSAEDTLEYVPDIAESAIQSMLAKEDFDALIVRNKVINRDAIKAWAKKKPTGKLCIICADSDPTTIDGKAAAAHGISVMNTPGANSQAVAQYIMAQMLILTAEGHLGQATIDIRNHIIRDKTEYKSRLLTGKTLALIGTGKIGAQVAALSKAFGMVIKGCSPHFTPEAAIEMGVVHCNTIEEALSGADFVSIQVPYTTEKDGVSHPTHFLFSDTEFSLLNDDAKLINVSRRDVVDTDALVRAIAANKITGVSLDLLLSEIEDLRKKAPVLFSGPNFSVTPLIACESPEADKNITKEALARVTHFYAPIHPVAMSTVNPNFSNHPRITHLSKEQVPEVVEYGRPWQLKNSFSQTIEEKRTHVPIPSHQYTVKKFATTELSKEIFNEQNLVVLPTISVPGVASIIMTHENEATPEKYAYSGIRVLSPMSEEEAITNAKRLSLTSSSWKNWLLNDVIKQGALRTLSSHVKETLPRGLMQKHEIYGGRIVVIPEKGTYKGESIEHILKDATHPYFEELSEPIYRAIGHKLNELGGTLKVTPDFGPNASTADIMHRYSPGNVLGIHPEKNGSGGKSEYSITSILTVLKQLGLDHAPKDAPISVIGAAGALGTGICDYLAAQGFTNVTVCDLEYTKTPPVVLPEGWKVAKAEAGKFTDECLGNSGAGIWLITAAYGDEMLNSNWKMLKPGTKWIAAQNKDLPEKEPGIAFAQALKARGIMHIPGQLLTIGGTTASRVEHFSRKEKKPFSKEAAHKVVEKLTNFLTSKMLKTSLAKGITPYEAMLELARKKNWQDIVSTVVKEQPQHLTEQAIRA